MSITIQQFGAMSSTMATSSSPTALPTPSQTDSSQQQNSGGPSSPLLFFVALGFGVVFTNLWIIVGVKYCFRYNQRNRARLNGEDPDGVDLNNIPRQRRRREKKLMTMEEVNERFPLIKYKIWRSTRADQGLPTAGGITNAPSRAASIKQELRISHDEGEPQTPTTATVNEKVSTPEHGKAEQISTTTPGTSSTDQSNNIKTPIAAPEPALVRTTTQDPEAEEVDVIQTAIPPEQLPDPGDTCAICIDTIEDDDDIRGLSCGHAFHASCVDPWLTSRRACCPLCKADYYVPKPRPDPVSEDVRRYSEHVATGSFAIVSGRRGNRRGRPFNLPGVFLGSPQPQTRASRGEVTEMSVPSTTTPEVTNGEQNSRTWRQRLPSLPVPALSRIRRGRGNEAGNQPTEVPDPTPAQLEAGTRPQDRPTAGS